MKIFFAIGYMEICLDSMGAKIDYFKYNGDNVLDDFGICIPNYGIDKTFRYPKNGLFADKNYEVVSKSDDMCVMKCAQEEIESFVLYQFTRDSILVNVTISNFSDEDIEMNPAIFYDFNRDVELDENVARGKFNSEKCFEIDGVNSVKKNRVIVFAKNEKFVLKSSDKISMKTEFKLL